MLQSLGIAQGALDMATEFLMEQEKNGISVSEELKFKLSEMATRTEAARLLMYKAASVPDHSLPSPFSIILDMTIFSTSLVPSHISMILESLKNLSSFVDNPVIPVISIAVSAQNAAVSGHSTGGPGHDNRIPDGAGEEWHFSK